MNATADFGRVAGHLEGLGLAGVIGVSAPDSLAVVPFGEADYAGDVREIPRPDDLFAITSITKPFTAVQVMTLVDDGLLDLDAPVAAYIPEFGANGKERVTTKHLLSHTSGLDQAANVIEGPPIELSEGEHLGLALNAGLVTAPGAVFAYCSPSFWVLGELVSRLTGTHYEDHLRERVLDPMGATSTLYYTGEVPPPGLVQAHPSPGLEHLPTQTRVVRYPAGGLISTARDVLGLGRAMIEAVGSRGARRLISPQAARLMRRPVAEGVIAGRHVRWGLGWEVGGPGNLRHPEGLYHAGASGVALWVDIEEDLVATVLTNTWGTPRKVFAEAINGIYGALGGSNSKEGP